MKALGFEKGSFSKKTVFSCGFQVHLYNADSIQPYLESLNSPDSLKKLHHENIPINVAYLIHPRDDDYTFTESIAYNLLHQYYAKKDKSGGSDGVTPLVCVTFDIPNHGSRLVDATRNKTWKEGNSTHALDMISVIDTTVEDIRLLIDAVPAHLNSEYYLSKSIRKLKGYENIGIDHYNIISGYSIGGHVSLRFAAKYPALTKIVNPVCGCSDLTSLLLNRLHENHVEMQKKQFYFEYSELDLPDEERLNSYPEALHRHISEQDIKIFENLSSSNIKIFASFGSADKVVPPELSTLWIDMYTINNGSSQSFVQEGIEHDVTDEMVDKFTSWLVKVTP